MLIVFGIGWIFGFLVRWGVHSYYIDPLGHCVVPVAYQYQPGMAKFAMDEVDFANIRGFFEEFNSTSSSSSPGDPEAFARALRARWSEDFGLQKVGVEEVDVMVPAAPAEGAIREIRVSDAAGKVVETVRLTEKNSAEVTQRPFFLTMHPELIKSSASRSPTVPAPSGRGGSFTGTLAV